MNRERLFDLTVLPLHATATAGFWVLAIPQLAWAQVLGGRMGDTPIHPLTRTGDTCIVMPTEQTETYRTAA